MWGKASNVPKTFLLTVVTTSLLCSASFAQDLVYEPINPSFGGNPFNSSHLLAVANAQNDFDPPSSGSSQSSDLDRFIRSLQSRLLSSLASEVANAIFGEDAQESGTISFGDQTVTFVRTLDGIVLTITDADGSQTVITIPILVTDDTGTGSGGREASLSPGQLDLSGLTTGPLTSGSLTGAPLTSGSLTGAPVTELGDTISSPIDQPLN